MARLILIVFALLVWQECSPRTITDEDSVVSVYTTQSTTSGVVHVDVYHQIANNIAERITSPIYRFFGIQRSNNTEATTKRSWDKIENLDEPEESTKDISPVSNDINEKDVEELSSESLKKTDKKPEKITLFSNYLPSKLEVNNTINEIGDEVESFGFDDLEDNESESRQGPFVYVLELLGSAIQLLYGGIVALFSNASKPT